MELRRRIKLTNCHWAGETWFWGAEIEHELDKSTFVQYKQKDKLHHNQASTVSCESSTPKNPQQPVYKAGNCSKKPSNILSWWFAKEEGRNFRILKDISHSRRAAVRHLLHASEVLEHQHAFQLFIWRATVIYSIRPLQSISNAQYTRFGDSAQLKVS